MASIAENILKITDHPVGREIADHFASGLSFGEALAKYDFGPGALRKIHEYRSRIETDLRMGKNANDVVNNYFPPATANAIMTHIHKYKDVMDK